MMTYENYLRWLKEEPGVVWFCDECGGVVEVEGYGTPAVGGRAHCTSCGAIPAEQAAFKRESEWSVSGGHGGTRH